jgi:hypothetical protein
VSRCARRYIHSTCAHQGKQLSPWDTKGQELLHQSCYAQLTDQMMTLLVLTCQHVHDTSWAECPEVAEAVVQAMAGINL